MNQPEATPAPAAVVHYVPVFVPVPVEEEEELREELAEAQTYQAELAGALIGVGVVALWWGLRTIWRVVR